MSATLIPYLMPLLTPAMTSNHPLTPLANLIKQRKVSADAVQFNMSEDWLQGRTLFGGLTAALAVQAMRDICGSDWPLRALQTSFVGPVPAGVFSIRVQLLRQGKNIRQVQAQLMQGEGDGAMVAAVFLGVFGANRESSLGSLRPAMPAAAKSVEESLPLPFIPNLTPNFTQHFDFRWADGAFPFMGADVWSSSVHILMHNPEGIDNELMAVMLADAGPTPPLARLKAPAAASSVSWALELRAVPSVDSDAFWRMDKQAHVVDDGYVNETTHLWTPDGRIAALGYQVVAVYA
jgi:acyl-CoA thioesterase